MAEQRNTVNPPELLPLEVAHDSEYVLSLPVYLAATLGCDNPEATLMRLPYFDISNTNGFIGLTLTAAGTPDPAVRIEPATRTEDEAGTFSLGPGETRRVLIDLSPLLPDTLAAGDYTAVLSYGYARKKTASAPFSIRLRRPEISVESRLGAWWTERNKAGTWSDWLRTRPADPAALKASIPPAGPLQFTASLRYALFAGDPGEAGRILATVKGLYRPEVEAYIAELQLQAGDSSSANEIVKNHPSLIWMLERVKAGNGLLAPASNP